jgi:signal transduction histidine kinase
MRRLVGILRSADEAGLEPQPSLRHLDALVDRVQRAGLPVALTIEGAASQLPAGVDLSAYRIVQQALANTLEHAGSAHAAVDIRYTPDAVEIEVSDDGAGPSERGADRYGHGLIGMRERAALYGGELVTGPRPGGGYAVRARLLLSGEAP